MAISKHRVRLELMQRPTKQWWDARAATLPVKVPTIIQGCAARLEFAVMQDSTTAALEEVTGLSLITLEIYAKRASGTSTAGQAIIAPAVFSGTLGTTLTLNEWQAGATDKCHFSFDLTGEETTVDVIDNDAGVAECWLEVYATLSGERKLLGSGPIFIERSAAGGQPAEALEQYYTRAQVDALVAAAGGTLVNHGAYATLTVGGVTVNLPTVTPG